MDVIVNEHSYAYNAAAAYATCPVRRKRTGVSCAVADCTGTHAQGLSLHGFPNDPTIRRQWIRFVQTCRADFGSSFGTPNRNSFICSRHFKADDYPDTYRIQEELGFQVRHRCLKEGAIPSIQKHAFSKPSKLKKIVSLAITASTCSASKTVKFSTRSVSPIAPSPLSLPVIPVRGAFAKRERQRVLSEILDSVSQPQVKPSSSPSEIEKTSCSGPLLVGSLAGTADTHVGLQSLVSTTKKRVWTGRKVLMPDTEDGAISTRSQQKEKCCVRHCSSNKQSAVDNSNTKTFFPFPREEARCRQWAKNCGRPELIQKSAIQLRLEGWRLCSDHFDSSQFQFSSCSKKRLTPEAVPSPVFKPQPRVKSKKSKAKKSTTGHKRPRLTEAEEEPLPEVKLEMDYAEDPTLGWVSGSLGAESADTEPLGMATQPQNIGWEPLDIKLEPQNVDWEPLDIKLEPPDFKLEPQNVVCEPLGFESKPQVCASEPADIKTEAQEFYWEPLEIKREPQNTECSPVQVSSVVLSEDPQVTDIKPEPVFFEDPRLGCGSGAHNHSNLGQHQESPSVIPSAVRQHSPSVTPAVRQHSPSVTPSAARQQSPSVTPSVIPTELTLAYYNCQRWMESFDSQSDNSDVEDDN